MNEYFAEVTITGKDREITFGMVIDNESKDNLLDEVLYACKTSEISGLIYLQVVYTNNGEWCDTDEDAAIVSEDYSKIEIQM